MKTKISFAVPALFAAAALTTTARAANQVLLRHRDIGDSGNAQVLASDSSGNIFTVSTITDQPGLPWVGAVKTDAPGNSAGELRLPSQDWQLPLQRAGGRGHRCAGQPGGCARGSRV